MNSFTPIPGPKGHFIIGNLLEFKKDLLAATISWHAQYGDLLRFKLGSRDVYLISHPEMIENALVQHQDVFVKIPSNKKNNGLALVLGQGLVTSTGELWRKQRRLIQPVFNRSSVVTMLPEMIKACEKLFTRWDQLPADSEIDLAQEMMRLTVEVITQTMFSTSVLEQVDLIAPAQTRCMRFAAKNSFNPFQAPLWMPTQANKQFINDCQLLDTIIYGMITQRRADKNEHHDLLQMLLDASDPETGENMSNKQVRDELLTIFSAGHATTANALSWAFGLLGTHPDILDKLKSEIRTVLNGKTPDLNDLAQLHYTKAVFDETLRIRPSIGLMGGRQLASDIEFYGFKLKKESLVMFSIYNLHHHNSFWDEPEKFNPDRFLDQEKRNKAYMPFGIGHRFCIGNNFAQLEGLLFLAMLIQRYDYKLVGSTLPEMDMVVSIRPKGGLPARIRKIA